MFRLPSWDFPDLTDSPEDRTFWDVSNYQPGFPISAGPMPVAGSDQGGWSLVSVRGACQSSLAAAQDTDAPLVDRLFSIHCSSDRVRLTNRITLDLRTPSKIKWRHWSDVPSLASAAYRLQTAMCRRYLAAGRQKSHLILGVEV